MGAAEVDLIRRMSKRWIELVDARDIDGVQPFADEFFAPDAWIDFGTRTTEAVPGHGTQIIVDWARQNFAEWRAQGIDVAYEIEEPEQVGVAIVARGRAYTNVLGAAVDNRFTYCIVVRHGKIVRMTIHATFQEAAAAAAQL